MSAKAQNTVPFEAHVSELTARHRQGQTFLTWKETVDATSYRIYRYRKPINKDNLSDAKIMATDIPNGSSKVINDGWPLDHLVFSDEGTPLSDGTGCYVFTASKQRRYYYAVTCVNASGQESKKLINGENVLSTPVKESP